MINSMIAPHHPHQRRNDEEGPRLPPGLMSGCHGVMPLQPRPQQSRTVSTTVLPPVASPMPTFQFGWRGSVLCHDPRDNAKLIQLDNVLMGGNPHHHRHQNLHAYYPLPSRLKHPTETRTGKLLVAVLLERLPGTGDEVIFRMLNNQWVAIKIHDLNLYAEEALQEASIMQTWGSDHPNVLGCRQVILMEDEDEPTLNVVMDYCEGGDLCDSIGKSSFTESHAKAVFQPIVEGIRYSHARRVYHGDISLENVVLQGFVPMVIDPGLSLRVPYTADGVRCFFQSRPRHGKLEYMAPEVYHEEPFDGEAADVWSLGVVLFCMLTGHQAYSMPDMADVHYRALTQNLWVRLSLDGITISPTCLDLLRSMLQVQPERRPSLTEVLCHPWFFTNVTCNPWLP